MADAGAGERILPAAECPVTRAIRSSGRAAAPRRHGAARRRRLGLCPRCDGARRGHHPELRSHRHPPRADRRGDRRRYDARVHRHEESASSPPAIRRTVMNMAGVRLPLESFPLQALVSRAGEADLPLRGDVEHGPRLYLAVRQGRDGDRRGHGRLHVLLRSRRPAHRQSYAGCDLRTVPDRSGACACCATGAASSTSRRIARRSWRRRRYPGCTSIAAGAPAASRRRRDRAMCSPARSPRTSRNKINAPFTIERFRDGRRDRRSRCGRRGALIAGKTRCS
jgi:hypothetical protein